MEDTRRDVEGPQHKESFFSWTNELIAEFAREVAEAYRKTDMWSGDLSCEKSLLNGFIKKKKMEEKMKGVITGDTGNTLIVDKKKFEALIEFLYNYRNPEN
jgi:hypothetical protein